MRRLVDLSNTEAKDFFLKNESYFNSDLPDYLNFEPLLSQIAEHLSGACYPDYRKNKAKISPHKFSEVNRIMLTNKDGKLDWRPLELVHPVIYVSLVNLLCEPENWELVLKRWEEYQSGVVECCSGIVIPDEEEKTKAAQVKNWWERVEQQSLRYSIEYSHVLHTDISNCYGSLYSHGIAWALHGYEDSKKHKQNCNYLGNHLDKLIGAGRCGQTNGISQGSVLMDFIAEIVLGYVDEKINIELKEVSNYKILRYRDDYRIFANNDDACEVVLKAISKSLLDIGMKLGNAKTHLCRNVVEGSIKPDKLAGIELNDMGTAQAKTLQKQLLRIHSFGQQYPNSGALKKLITVCHTSMFEDLNEAPEDIDVLVAIASDIGFTSPSTFPAIAAILSKLISLAQPENKPELWEKVKNKMARVPNNGYLDIWLQRVVLPKEVGLALTSDNPICKIVNNEHVDIWNNEWITNKDLQKLVDSSLILVASATDSCEVVPPKEIELFRQNAWQY